MIVCTTFCGIKMEEMDVKSPPTVYINESSI